VDLDSIYQYFHWQFASLAAEYFKPDSEFKFRLGVHSGWPRALQFGCLVKNPSYLDASPLKGNARLLLAGSYREYYGLGSEQLFDRHKRLGHQWMTALFQVFLDKT
jgi:hypothetical protein